MSQIPVGAFFGIPTLPLTCVGVMELSCAVRFLYLGLLNLTVVYFWKLLPVIVNDTVVF
jgi:hypothetical protein